jgi:hypothetical protein
MDFPQLHVGIGRQFGPFTIFPVWSDNPGNLGLSTGAHAPLEVSEVAGGPEVNRLTVRNTGSKAALLIEGELLEKDHQDRVVVESRVLGPGEQAELRAARVENGSWGATTEHTRRTRHAPLHVRAGLAGLGCLAERTDDSFRAHSAADLEQPAPLEGQRGVVVGLLGRALMLELFGTSTLYARHWNQIADSLRLEERHLIRHTTGQSARDFAAALSDVDRYRLLSPDMHPVTDHRGPMRVRQVHTTIGRFAYNGVSISRPDAEHQFAHLSVWDTSHPLISFRKKPH